MVRIVGNFVNALGNSMIVLGFILSSSVLVGDEDPNPVPGPSNCKTSCSLTCFGLQSNPAACLLGNCATTPVADCGGCAICGHKPWQGGYLCFCSR
jgi:hypothetical protein